MSSQHASKLAFALDGVETFHLMLFGLDLVRLLELDALVGKSYELLLSKSDEKSGFLAYAFANQKVKHSWQAHRGCFMVNRNLK